MSVGLFAASALFVVAIATTALSTATGMGGGVVLFVAILQFFPVNVTVAIHGLVQMVANIVRTFALRTHLDMRICLPFLIGAVLGVFAVYQVLHRIESDVIPFSIILVLISYTLFKPAKMPDLKIPNWGFAPLGLVTGFLALLVGAVDPILAPFFIRDDFSKHEVVANKAFMQAVIHFAKLPVFLSLGFAYQQYSLLLAVLIAGSLVGTYVGVSVLEKIDRKMFLKVFKIILFFIGARIFYRLVTLVAA